jgi:hypothetical protein
MCMMYNDSIVLIIDVNNNGEQSIPLCHVVVYSVRSGVITTQCRAHTTLQAGSHILPALTTVRAITGGRTAEVSDLAGQHAFVVLMHAAPSVRSMPIVPHIKRSMTRLISLFFLTDRRH